MPRLASVFVDQQLRMKVTSLDCMKTIIVRLNRIQAQQLSDALLAYAGIAHKSYARGSSTGIPAIDLTELPPAPKTSGRVRLSSPSRKSGVVRIR